MSMIAKGFQRRRRDGVDGLGSDQFLDVPHVAVPRILGTGARPQQALWVCSPGRQALPLWCPAQFQVALVRELRVGNGHRSEKACP